MYISFTQILRAHIFLRPLNKIKDTFLIKNFDANPIIFIESDQLLFIDFKIKQILRCLINLLTNYTLQKYFGIRNAHSAF